MTAEGMHTMADSARLRCRCCLLTNMPLKYQQMENWAAQPGTQRIIREAFPRISPRSPSVRTMCFRQSLECLNFCSPLACIITFTSSAGVVTNATTNPATAPLSAPSQKVSSSLPRKVLQPSQETNTTELMTGSVRSGQQTPLNNCAQPQCLMMWVRTWTVLVNLGSTCMRTFTVSRKNPERVLTTPDRMPLEKSMRLLIIGLLQL